MKILLYSILFFLLNASNCSSTKDFKEIKFGEGGGFTGAVSEYEIKSNGEIFLHQSLDSSVTKVGTISKTEMQNIQDKLNKLLTEELQFNHPSNLYYFIEAEKGDQKIKVTWGDPSYAIPNNIKSLYNELKSFINH